MPASGIVPAFDELEDGHPGLSFRPEGPAVQEFGFERREEALADPIEGRTPASLQRRPKATDVYCDPWSE